MSVDLRSARKGGTWTRRFGDHEAAGLSVSINDESASVRDGDLGIPFTVDRQDLPSAWDATIDVEKIRAELASAIVHRMSAEVLDQLLRGVRSQRQRAFCDGAQAARAEIRKALGL